jgi:hypothetical protein
MAFFPIEIQYAVWHAHIGTKQDGTRWETATYKPSISDSERLARFFGVPITIFFPQPAPKARTNALLSATADLDDETLEEVTPYAQFRRARQRKKTR